MSDNWVKVAAANILIEMRPTDRLDDVAGIIRTAHAPHAAKVRALVEDAKRSSNHSHAGQCCDRGRYLADDLRMSLRAVKEEMEP